MKTLGLATCERYPALSPDDLTLPDRFRAAGVDAVPFVWNRDEFGAFDAVVIRSTWDYHEQPGAFLDWVARVEAAGTTLLNSPSTIRWNSRKRYLRELEAAGVPVIPTIWPGPDVGPLVATAITRWGKVVVKPEVGANAVGARIFDAGTLDEARAHAATLRRQGEVLIQPFLPQIGGEGEWSLVFFDRVFSHAVVKRPVAGDFRVQPDHGGVATAAQPTPEILAIAGRVLACVPGALPYARVDGVVLDGGFRLMELEVLEPGLFLRTSPGADDRYVAAIVAHSRFMRMSRSSPGR